MQTQGPLNLPEHDAGSRSERAYEHIRTGILRGTRAPGSLVSDAEVAADLGMSNTPVREALKQLEHEGLLERGARRQLFVRELPEGYRDEIIDVREALGAITVRRACRALSPDDVDLLRLSLLKQKRAAETGDEERFSELDEDFHLTLTRLAGLPIVVQFLRQIRGFVRLMRLGTERREGYLLEVLAEHEAIVDAIERRDEEAAVAAFSEHVRTTDYPG